MVAQQENGGTTSKLDCSIAKGRVRRGIQDCWVDDFAPACAVCPTGCPTGTASRLAGWASTLDGYARSAGFDGATPLGIEHDFFRFYRLQ